MTAFDAMHSAPPRPQSVENVAEEAFGNDEPTVPDDRGGEDVAADDAITGGNAHVDAADADEGDASVEELLEIMDDNVVDDVDNWVACSRCNEWRIVPSGQFLTFQHRDVKVFSLVGASYHLVKKRRRG